MLLVRKASCSKCKFKCGSDEHHIYACDFEKCRMKDNSMEILDTEDEKTETYSIDEVRNYVVNEGIEIANLHIDEDDLMIISR